MEIELISKCNLLSMIIKDNKYLLSKYNNGIITHYICNGINFFDMIGHDYYIWKYFYHTAELREMKIKQIFDEN